MELQLPTCASGYAEEESRGAVISLHLVLWVKKNIWMKCGACEGNKRFLPFKSDILFSHFSATTQTDSVGAWVDIMWISPSVFTSSAATWTGNGGTAISYAIHQHVKPCARSFLYGNGCLPAFGILWVREHMSGVLFGFDSLMKIKQRCHTNMPLPSVALR